LINALIERWRCETHTFHLRHGKMTSPLQDVTILLRIYINEQVVIFIGMCNRIVLSEYAFVLALSLSELKRAIYILNGLKRHLPYHQVILTTRSFGGIHQIII